MDAGESNLFDTCPGDLGEPIEEMTDRRWELVTPYELTVLAEPLLDTIVMEDSQSDWHGLADPASTDESDWSETLCQRNDLLNQIVTSKTGFRRRRR